MNSVAAPLLCIMPEVDAYYCYKLLIRDHMPTYFCRASGNNAGMEGANLGVAVCCELNFHAVVSHITLDCYYDSREAGSPVI